MTLCDFRTEAAPDITLRSAAEAFVKLPWYDPVIQVKLVWIDAVTLEYAQASRSAYERTNAAHSANCGLKARLPLDRAMAWTRERRMAAKKVWIVTQPDAKNHHDRLCSHRIAFKNPLHAFEFKMRWA